MAQSDGGGVVDGPGGRAPNHGERDVELPLAVRATLTGRRGKRARKRLRQIATAALTGPGAAQNQQTKQQRCKHGLAALTCAPCRRTGNGGDRA